MNDFYQIDGNENAADRFPFFSGMFRFSPTVRLAQSYLRSAVSEKPQAYQSRYAEQIASLYDQIMNRPAFSYNVHQDPLYQQYRNQYVREGQRAMQDTLGASAALTGGYGNSWANTAAYQAYGEYLKALSDKVPELEKRAWERYSAAGDDLNSKANLALNLDNREYGMYRDTVKDWQYENDFALEQKKFNLQAQQYRDKLLSSVTGAASVLPIIIQTGAVPGVYSMENQEGYVPALRAAREKNRTGR